MKTFDSLNNDAVQAFAGHELGDQNGESVFSRIKLWLFTHGYDTL